MAAAGQINFSTIIDFCNNQLLRPILQPLKRPRSGSSYYFTIAKNFELESEGADGVFVGKAFLRFLITYCVLPHLAQLAIYYNLTNITVKEGWRFYERIRGQNPEVGALQLQGENPLVGEQPGSINPSWVSSLQNSDTLTHIAMIIVDLATIQLTFISSLLYAFCPQETKKMNEDAISYIEGLAKKLTSSQGGNDIDIKIISHQKPKDSHFRDEEKKQN